MKDLSNRRSILQSGMLNSRAKPDITKQMIVDAVVKYVKENNKSNDYILRMEIEEILKQELDVSIMILKQRFTNGLKELITDVNSNLSNAGLAEVKYDPYYRGDRQKKKLSLASATYRWATDGIENIRLNSADLDKFLLENKQYKQGRTL